MDYMCWTWKPKEQEQALAGNTDLLQMFHERLVHQNKRHVKEILKHMNISVIDANKSFCDGCALGKMHRLFFGIHPSQSENVGELIHAERAYVNYLLRKIKLFRLLQGRF